MVRLRQLWERGAVIAAEAVGAVAEAEAEDLGAAGSRVLLVDPDHACAT